MEPSLCKTFDTDCIRKAKLSQIAQKGREGNNFLRRPSQVNSKYVVYVKSINV